MLQYYAKSMVQLPVPDHERPCTDKLCAVLGPLFFITIFALAIGFRHPQYIQKIKYSVDSDGRTCGGDLPSHPYLYYPDFEDYSKQLCVAKCPRMGDQSIECYPTNTIPCPDSETIVDTQKIKTNRGNYCLPKFSSFRQQVISKAGLITIINEGTALRIAKACIPLALCFGVLFLVLIQFFPRCMIWNSLFGAGLCLLVLSVLVFSDWSSIWQKHKALQIVVGIVLLFLGITMVAVIWVYRGQIALCDIFLRYAALMLRYYSPMLFLCIPVFTVIIVIFMIICYLQHISFMNFYPPQLQPSRNYYESNPSYPLLSLNIFCFFWGLNVIRDAFSYVMSGNAVQWYFMHQPTNITLPLKRMLLKNIGSIYGGSYLNTLFLIPSLIFDAVTCQQKIFSSYYENGCHNNCCHSFLSFINIARKDSYSYINLTGIQYCNAARECQQLCARSALFPGSHSCLLPFRIAAHLSSLLPVVIITIFYLMRVGSGGQFQFYPIFLVTFLSFCLLTFFVDIHADIAQSLQICYFIECQLYESHPDGNVWVGPIEMKNQIQGAEMRYSRIGNTTVL